MARVVTLIRLIRGGTAEEHDRVHSAPFQVADDSLLDGCRGDQTGIKSRPVSPDRASREKIEDRAIVEEKIMPITPNEDRRSGVDLVQVLDRLEERGISAAIRDDADCSGMFDPDALRYSSVRSTKSNATTRPAPATMLRATRWDRGDPPR